MVRFRIRSLVMYYSMSKAGVPRHDFPSPNGHDSPSPKLE